jgi:hypothetical protein
LVLICSVLRPAPLFGMGRRTPAGGGAPPAPLGAGVTVLPPGGPVLRLLCCSSYGVGGLKAPMTDVAPPLGLLHGPPISVIANQWLIVVLSGGGFLVRFLVLVGASRGRTGPFFRLPGRGPWWVPGGTTHQVGWSGEARGSHGGATGSAALTFPPGWGSGRFFFRGVPSETIG